MNTGTCTLVGAGPGDPELLTLKALKAIQAATVLLVDDLVSDAIVAHASPTARIVSALASTISGAVTSSPRRSMMPELATSSRPASLRHGTARKLVTASPISWSRFCWSMLGPSSARSVASAAGMRPDSMSVARSVGSLLTRIVAMRRAPS